MNLQTQHLIEVADKATRRFNSKKFSTPVLVRYARICNYETCSLERILERLRKHRQDVLRAANARPFNIFRWFKYQRIANSMRIRIEQILIELYKSSGNLEFLGIVQGARFATPELIWRIKHAR